MTLQFKYISLLIFISLLIVFLNSCSKPDVVFKEVKVPVKCDTPQRHRPQHDGNVVSYLKSVLVYTEMIEHDLDYCRGNQSGADK